MGGRDTVAKLDHKLAGVVGMLNRGSDWEQVPEVVMLTLIEITALLRDQNKAMREMSSEISHLKRHISGSSGRSSGSGPVRLDKGMIDQLAELQREGNKRYRSAYSRAAIAELKNAEAAADAAAGGEKMKDASREPETSGAEEGSDKQTSPGEGGILQGKEKKARKGKGVRFAEEDAVYVYTVNLGDYDEVAVAEQDGSVKEVTRRGSRKNRTKEDNKELIFVFENDDNSSIASTESNGSGADSEDASDANSVGSVGSVGSLGSVGSDGSDRSGDRSADRSNERDVPIREARTKAEKAEARALRKQMKLKRAAEAAKAAEEDELRRAFEQGGPVPGASSNYSPLHTVPGQPVQFHEPSDEVTEVSMRSLSPEPTEPVSFASEALPHSMQNVLRHSQWEREVSKRGDPRAPRADGDLPAATTSYTTTATATGTRYTPQPANTRGDSLGSTDSLGGSSSSSSTSTVSAAPCPTSPEHVTTRKVVKVPPGKRLLRVFMRGGGGSSSSSSSAGSDGKGGGGGYGATAYPRGAVGDAGEESVTDDDELEMSPELAMLVSVLART